MWKLRAIIALCCMTIAAHVFALERTEDQKKITVVGKLVRVAAIGGESTGWAVQLDSEIKVQSKSLKSIEVSAQDKELAKLENKHVEARGKITVRHGIERGDWPVLEVTTIREIKSK